MLDEGFLFKRERNYLNTNGSPPNLRVIIALLFILTFLLCICGGVCLIFSGLTSSGRRAQVKKAIRTANYNAALWAQSEAYRQLAELENARLKGVVETSQQLYSRMSDIAREAIKAGEVKVDMPASLRLDVSEWPDNIE